MVSNRRYGEALPRRVGPTGNPPPPGLVQIHIDLHPANAIHDGVERLGIDLV